LPLASSSVVRKFTGLRINQRPTEAIALTKATARQVSACAAFGRARLDTSGSLGSSLGSGGIVTTEFSRKDLSYPVMLDHEEKR
jgi:hypothetical protein